MSSSRLRSADPWRDISSTPYTAQFEILTSCGAIAGIVVGSVLVVSFGGFAIFWFAIKKKSFAELMEAIKSMSKKKTPKK